MEFVAVLREVVKEPIDVAWPLLTDSTTNMRARRVVVGEEENTCVSTELTRPERVNAALSAAAMRAKIVLVGEEENTCVLSELIDVAWPLLTSSAAAMRARIVVVGVDANTCVSVAETRPVRVDAAPSAFDMRVKSPESTPS